MNPELFKILRDSVPFLVLENVASHFPELMELLTDERFGKFPALNPVDRSKLSRAQKSDLNRFIRHKKKDGRSYDSSAREWQRKEVLNARPNR